MVHFSSLAAAGSPGQGNYAAANASLDSLAAASQCTGVPAVGIQWGAWADIGMAQGGVDAARRSGAGALAPAQGAACLITLLNAAASFSFMHPSVVASAVDWDLFLGTRRPPQQQQQPQQLNAPRHDSLFREMQLECVAPLDADMVDLAERGVSAVKPSGTSAIAITTESVGSAIAEMVESFVGGSVPAEQPLMEAGLDSLSMTELSAEISSRFGVQLPGTFAFDYPNVSAMTQFVGGQIGAVTAAERVNTSIAHAHGSSRNDGSSYGAAAGVASDASARGGITSGSLADEVQIMPTDRVFSPERDGAAASTSTLFGTFLPRFDLFDAAFFGIGTEEATQMDPQHRMLMQCAQSAIGPAGTGRSGFLASLVGIATQDYEILKSAYNEPIGVHSATSNALSVAPGRLAFAFDLKGPSLSIDTACSSSLVAAHLGLRGLSRGDFDGAVVAGVSLILAGRNTMMFQRAGMLAPDGRCKTLDAGADGYVRAEGCEVITLTCDASEVGVALGGSAVNQDGRSSSLTAPNGPSQQGVISAALKAGGILAAEVTSLQMHGTGTPLGDPIEVGGLLGVLGGSGTGALVLGALKSYVGHAECAAGAAGLVHAAATLSCRQVASVMHLRRVNPHVSTAIAAATGGRVVLPKAGHGHAADAMNQRRAAGVSSFAFQGTNAHTVVSASSGDVLPSSSKSCMLDQRRFWINTVPLPLLRRDTCFNVRQLSASVEICLDGNSASDASIFDGVSVRGASVLLAASLVEMASAWIGCCVTGAAGAEQVSMLNNVQAAVTPLGASSGVVLKVDLNAGSSYEVTRLMGSRHVRCLVGNAAPPPRSAAALPSGCVATSSASAARIIHGLQLQTDGAQRAQVVLASVSSSEGEQWLGPALAAAAHGPGATAAIMTSARAVVVPAQSASVRHTELQSCATAQTISLLASAGGVAARLAGVTHQSALSVNITEVADAADAASSTDQAGASAVAAFQFPQMYRLEWKPLSASGSRTGAGDGQAASPEIHFKRFDAYDASGRGVLKEVYHMASGGAALGFEVDVDSIVKRAKMSARQPQQPADADEEEDAAVIAAATSELLAVLREAAADAAVPQGVVPPPPFYLFTSRGAARRPTVAALVTLARGLQLEHPRVYGGTLDLDVLDNAGEPAWRPATVSDVAYSVAVDADGRGFAARLVPATTELVEACSAEVAAPLASLSMASAFGPTCCITGGTGGLGLVGRCKLKPVRIESDFFNAWN